MNRAIPVGRGILVALCLCLAILHFAERINLTNADLGRHLKNGELCVRQGRVLATNFYSYTHPDFPAICHHWLTGVIFYGLWQSTGWFGLSLFYQLALLATFAIFWVVAARQSGFSWALFCAVLILPLAGCRTAIRPEGLSTLFLAADFLLLTECRRGRLRPGWLWLIPAIQIAWVNCHIFFFFAWFLVGLFAVDALVREGWGRTTRVLTWIGVATVAVSLINPFGLRGWLEPFAIFRSFGYQVAEDQSVWFMLKRFPRILLFPYFLALFALACVVLIARFWRERNWRALVLPVMLHAFFGLMALRTARAIALWGFVGLPVMAEMLATLFRGPDRGKSPLRAAAPAVAAGLLILVGLFFPGSIFSPVRNFSGFVPADHARYRDNYFYVLIHPEFWVGPLPGIDESARFWRRSGLAGPIFNNFDIGAYLIFYLFPREKVFVDNRPEAYPVEFFQQLYNPLQVDDPAWQQAEQRFGFQAIYFTRYDFTSRAQRFLLRRLQDPQWAPVFADDYALIFAKRGGVNQPVIDRFEIPQSRFAIPANRRD